ncbi:hutD family protein [Enterobacterales bacterium CwR94]|nr:hutD family protein [Enterobacterales bacterium CwR94]
MIRLLDYTALPATRWKNGAGETREIISVPAREAGFLWRASIATVSQDGPFSPFMGIDRVITLLEGEPFQLVSDSTSHLLQLHQPWSFAGETPIEARQVRSAGLDFNVMTLRGQAQSSVCTASVQQSLQHEGVAWVLKGRWQTPVGEIAPRGGVVWDNTATGMLTPLTANALLLWATIVRHN